MDAKAVQLPRPTLRVGNQRPRAPCTSKRGVGCWGQIAFMHWWTAGSLDEAVHGGEHLGVEQGCRVSSKCRRSLCEFATAAPRGKGQWQRAVRAHASNPGGAPRGGEAPCLERLRCDCRPLAHRRGNGPAPGQTCPPHPWRSPRERALRRESPSRSRAPGSGTHPRQRPLRPWLRAGAGRIAWAASLGRSGSATPASEFEQRADAPRRRKRRLCTFDRKHCKNTRGVYSLTGGGGGIGARTTKRSRLLEARNHSNDALGSTRVGVGLVTKRWGAQSGLA